MSVVVRIDVPRSCDKCDLCKRCEAFRYYILQIAEAVPVRPKPYPLCDGCLFVCHLPDGHGDLIDRDSMVEEWVDEKIGNPHADYEADDVIYDLKKRTVIVPKDKAHEP